MGGVQANILAEKEGVDSFRFLPQLRSFDPRMRVASAFAFAAVVAALHSLPMLIAAFIVSLVCAAMARLPLMKTLLHIAVVESFILVLILTLPFTMAGETLFTVAGLPVSKEGLLRAAEVGLKANGILFMLIAMVGSMEPSTLGHALHHLKMPEKLVHIFLFTVRYIDVLYQEYRALRTAMKCRGFRARTDLHTLRTIGYLVGMLLVRSLERSDRIMEAMKCRGFDGRFHVLVAFESRPRDFVLAAFLGLVSLGLLWGEYLA